MVIYKYNSQNYFILFFVILKYTVITFSKFRILIISAGGSFMYKLFRYIRKMNRYSFRVHIQLFSAYTYFYYILYIFFIHILYSCNNYNLLLYCIIFRQKAQYIFGIFCQIKFKYFHVAIYDFQHTLKISRYSVPLQDTGCGLYALRKASASGTEHLL